MSPTTTATSPHSESNSYTLQSYTDCLKDLHKWDLSFCLVGLVKKLTAACGTF